jgi:hypothetical protein
MESVFEEDFVVAGVLDVSPVPLPVFIELLFPDADDLHLLVVRVGLALRLRVKPTSVLYGGDVQLSDSLAFSETHVFETCLFSYYTIKYSFS